MSAANENLVLNTVPETAEVTYPDLTPNDAPDELFDLPSSPQSGITTHSQAEISGLDQDAMTTALSFLYDYADSVLKRVASHNAIQVKDLHLALQDPTSKSARTYRALADGLRLNLKHFAQQPPMNVELAVRVMAGLSVNGEIPDAPWRPDPVLYMANLAHYLLALLSFPRESDEAEELLVSLYNDFPLPFGPPFELDPDAIEQSLSNDLIGQTFSLVLEIRTQYLLQQLTYQLGRPSFDPDDMTRQVFYLDDSDELRGFSIWDQQPSLSPGLESLFVKRITTIRQHFSSDNNEDSSADIASLNSAFPYDVFLNRFISWSALTTNVQRQVLAARGGVQEIQRFLQEMVAGETPPVAEAVLWRPQAQIEGGGNTGKNSESAVSTRAVVEMEATGVVQPHSRRSNEWYKKSAELFNQIRSAQDHAARRSSENRAGERQISLSQKAQEVQAVIRKQALQSNKENIDLSTGKRNAFIDRQAGAERVSFDSQDIALAQQTLSSGPLKRKRGARQVRDTEEDGVLAEVQDKDVRPAKRVEMPFPDSQSKPTQHEAVQRQDLDTGPSNLVGDDDDEIAPSSRRVNRGISTLPRSSQISQVNKEAKRVTSTARVKGPQSRRPWSEEETLGLLELIEMEGTSWAELKQLDSAMPEPLFSGRDQVALKDKARNLKMDYLK